MPERPRMMPPVGKSGPGTMPINSSMPRSGFSISATQASMTSPRLCGGIFVAMPTAMPPAPFGVAHGRGRIAVDRTEIALPVDERQAHGEILRHAHERVVDRLVAVGMV